MSTILVNNISPYSGATVNLNGISVNNGALSATTYLNYPTTFLDGLTADTISATTYYGDGSNLTGVGGQVEVVVVTYSGLVSTITASTLSAGTYYLISDFKTCYDTPEYYINGNTKGSGEIDYKQGSVEPIIVLATSVNTISSTAYQPAYPNDRIQYDWTWNTTEITGGIAYGRITERIDEYNNRTDYDHRNIFFNRFQSYNRNSQLTGTINSLVWSQSRLIGNGTSFLSEVNPGDILLIDGYQVGGIGVKVVSATTDTELTFVTDPTFGGIPFCAQTYTFYSAESTGNYDEYKEVYIGQKNQDDWDDILTFNLNGTSVHNYVGDYSKFYIQEVGSNSGFLLANNVFYGNNIYSNTIGDRSYNNTGRYWFTRNTIAGRFYNNMIHQNGFYSNSIGEYFNNNIVKASVYGNVIKQWFEDNEIYSEFYDNDIDNGFYNNKIYSSFHENKIGIYFDSNKITQPFYINEVGYSFYNNEISGETHTNKIGEQFENNTIYGEFYDNQIFNEFKGNITYQDFYANKIDWGFGGNQFSGSCSENAFGPIIDSNDFFGIVLGNTFRGAVFENTIGDNFVTNNIGFGFGYNTIGENFGYGASSPQGNIIGNAFSDNTIGEYFYNNSIPDNFHDNTIGNYFQWNVINTNIDTTDFTFNYGNITGFTYSYLGSTATDNIYTGLTTITNGIGVNATFDVEVFGDVVIGVTGNTQGKLYVTGNTLTILGTQIGGVTGEINLFTSNAIGKTGVTGSYAGIVATSGTGENATFNITVTSSLVTDIQSNNKGGGYLVGDTLKILGSTFGGTDGVDDITITVIDLYSDDIVITVTDVNTKPSVYENYTCQLFEREGGNKRLLYYDNSDILTIKNINE